MNPYGSSQSSINPALLAQYQGNYNTAQLMNGMMSQPSISPSQLLNQQHHHQQIPQQRAVMNGGGMNMMGIGINTSSPTSPPNQMPVTATSLIAMGHHPNNQQILSYGREQQQVSNPKLIMAAQQMHMQHQQMPQQQQYDPSSQIMPPHPRPPTAQSSRPGTAMDINTRTVASPPRPLSRTAENGIMGAPMYAPTHSTPAPSMSPPPGSPSPYRTGLQNNPMKRKMPDQSPIGMNMMGMPPQQSINGFPPAQAQTQHQRASPGPMGNMGMPMNGMAGMNMVQSGGNLGNIPGMGHLAMGMNDLNNSIGMAGPMAMGMPQQPATPTQPQAMQSQPQTMLMGQPGLPDISHPIRQGSLPPTTSTPVKPPPSRHPSVAPPTSIPGTNPALGDASAPSLAPSTSTSSTSQSLLPPLPRDPNLNPATTKVTVLPLFGSEKAIPPLESEEITQVQEWMKIDKEYEGRYRKMKERMNDELRNDTFGPFGIRWWEKGAISVNPGITGGWRNRAREPFDVRYPRRKDRDTGRKKSGKREGLKLPRTLHPEDANRPEQLVPIRLEFDVDHHKMRDTFVWNLNDPVVTPEHFAQTVVEDYNLTYNYHSIIAKQIHDQLNDFKAHSNNYDGEGGEFLSTENTLQAGSLDEENHAWWEAWRKRLRTDSRLGRSGTSQNRKRRRAVKLENDGSSLLPDEKPMSVEEISLKEDLFSEDMRILIKLDIIVGSVKLDDQFEWDLDNASASPEYFAEVYTSELGLGGEFKTAIAHSIREQVQTYQKSLFLVGHASDGEPIQDEDLKLSFLPTLMSGARAIDQVPSFTPLLNYLSDGEVERNEKERDKEMNRRKKRNTRGRRGVALPDREPIRTYRTPAIGFPELDAATQALAAAAAAPARRAAAAAASVTIANMVASENGTPFLPQSVSTTTAPQPVPTVPKKKPKGLYKAPAVPQHLLRPRAHIVAPTPSTAVDVSTLPAPLENDPPPSTSAPLDNRIPRILTVRRTREMEREAKEREFVDGQHPNIIDGVWHCSNCGCPESIAIGRRKGPLGEKSQCGTCGKYWHRHRRPRPVKYNTDPEFHLAIQETEIAKTIAKKKGGAAALRAQSATIPTTPAEVPSEPPTPTRSKGSDEPAPPREDDRAISPVSTVSSSSEPPLAQRIKANGTTPTQATTSEPAPPAAPPSPKETREPPVAAAAPEQPVSPSKQWAPQWLAAAMQATHVKYPNDRFDVALRRVNASSPPEWRIKCTDCPGKLYKPGPGETLSNFEVHLKNRQHRQRVDDRVNAGDP